MTQGDKAISNLITDIQWAVNERQYRIATNITKTLHSRLAILANSQPTQSYKTR